MSDRQESVRGTSNAELGPHKERPLDVVAEQAEDEGLWFIAQTAPEAHLQDALRRLTAAVEGTPWPMT